MTFDTSTLPAFLLASLVVVITPGMDAFLLLRTSLRAGTRAGLRALAGVHTASAVQIALVASGLGALLAGYPALLQVLRWLGAAYLAFLAAQIVRGLIRPRPAESDEPVVVAHPFRQGFLSNLMNPKMLLFSLAFLPQFIGSGDAVLQLGVLGALFLVLAACWEATIVLAAGRMSRRLKRRGVTTALDAVSAAAFLTISVGLVLA
ncbi:LysE family translocator [Kutzneria sp. CA-103260]|uniref:LysE family translocator n=1 Tax=Kutzneria sp. CA-103260 TaxID=2802641 RepID=UPI001BA9765E|nr:LysE family translocator [Kutzneria sp. CA-103260]QUQ71564.1 LysE type translocator/threonine efflux protein [Kutzneria sp. CA-103260]